MNFHSGVKSLFPDMWAPFDVPPHPSPPSGPYKSDPQNLIRLPLTSRLRTFLPLDFFPPSQSELLTHLLVHHPFLNFFLSPTGFFFFFRVYGSRLLPLPIPAPALNFSFGGVTGNYSFFRAVFSLYSGRSLALFHLI